MAEFYVTYARDDGRASARARRRAANSAPIRQPRGLSCGDGRLLGHAWQLQYEIPGYGSAEWLERMAQASGVLKLACRLPPDSIFSMGTIPFAGG